MAYNQPILHQTLGSSTFKLLRRILVVRTTFENTTKNQVFCNLLSDLKLTKIKWQWYPTVWSTFELIYITQSQATSSIIKWTLPVCSHWNLLFLNFLFYENSNLSDLNIQSLVLQKVAVFTFGIICTLV